MADETAAVAVYALDVGQGDCSFVVSGDPADGVVLFDCNDAYVAERFVVDHKIEHLHAVVVSHLDRDHIRGLLPFMQWFLSDKKRRISQAYVGFDRARTKMGAAAAELITALLGWQASHGLALRAPQREDTPRSVIQARAWSAQIVLPRYDDLIGAEMEGDDEPNRCSIALRVACGDRAVLLGGDVPLISWERLEPPLVRADVVRAPHHGGGIRDGSPTWDESTLYRTAGADAVIISAGTENQHNHPVDDHLMGIGAPKRRLVCTQLTPRCHNDVQGMREEMLRTASGVTYAPYRHKYVGGTKRARPRKEVPCAGSIVIELFEDGTVGIEPPRLGWHDQLLDRLHLTSPRCRSTT